MLSLAAPLNDREVRCLSFSPFLYIINFLSFMDLPLLMPVYMNHPNSKKAINLLEILVVLVKKLL